MMKTQLNRLGDCRDESLVIDLFGSVSEFARLVEERGNDFTYGKVTVQYDPFRDVHTFFLPC